MLYIQLAWRNSPEQETKGGKVQITTNGATTAGGRNGGGGRVGSVGTVANGGNNLWRRRPRHVLDALNGGRTRWGAGARGGRINKASHRRCYEEKTESATTTCVSRRRQQPVGRHRDSTATSSIYKSAMFCERGRDHEDCIG